MEYVTKVRPSITVSWEDDLGGEDTNFFVGEFLRIKTKRGKEIYGHLVGFQEAEDELMQDIIILRYGMQEIKVGIYSISKIERCEDGKRMD